MGIITIKNLMNAGFITQVIDPSKLAENSIEELMEMGIITHVVDKEELEAFVTCTTEKHCDTCTCNETPAEPQPEPEPASYGRRKKPQPEPEQTTTPSDEELLNQMIEEENNQ